jgi:hypothetical protein
MRKAVRIWWEDKGGPRKSTIKLRKNWAEQSLKLEVSIKMT